MEIFRIAVTAVAGMTIALLLRQSHPEYAVYLSLAVGLIILFAAAGRLSGLVESIRKIQEALPVESAYLTILLKMIGITYIGQFAAGICRDAGYGAIAGQIELFGRLSVLAVGMPVVTALLEMLYGFLD